ncbi:Golgi integral membrane protein 4-like isoform X2 [Bacillus rossius redtenbacheri]|uniref:Golgi integral membrane protein 4-like isoform X2 n=1 Tax=Bacillus rossius redtenbacheri TaxID=93214 RepID=UPI002FDDC1F7
MMSSTRFIRGMKSRYFLYISGISLIGVVIYLYRGVQIHLEDVRRTSEKCQQQQESLSAQLQVVFEYKLRLEKSLHQEKSEHMQTKQELQKKFEEEKQLRERENLESSNKYSALLQQHKLLKSQHEDLNDECSKVRASQLQSLEEISKLESQLQAVQSELRQFQAVKEKDVESLKTQYMDLEMENKRLIKKYNVMAEELPQTNSKLALLQKENAQLRAEHDQLKRQLEECRSKCEADANAALLRKSESENVLPQPGAVKASELKGQSSSSPVVPNQQQQDNVLQLPDSHPAADKLTSKSTTPEINPDAILSQERAGVNAGGGNVVPVPPPQDDVEPAAAAQDEADQQVKEEEKKGVEGEGVGPAPERSNVPQHIPQQPPYVANHVWQNVPPGVVPVPYNNYNGVQDAGPHGYDSVREHGHLQGHMPVLAHGQQQQQWQQRFPGRQVYQPGGMARQAHNQYPDNADYEKGQKGDLQLEEGEEEDDDDLDQIDYGNEGNGAAKPKHAALYHGLPAMNAGNNLMVHQN